MFRVPKGGLHLLSKSDYRYFEKAKCAAKISDYRKVHIGCVAVYQGSVIGVGCNANKTHPRQKYYNSYRLVDEDFNYQESLPPKIHAEISCLNSIRNLDIDFSKVKLYIYRIKHDQTCGMARPCPGCMAAIQDVGTKNIYYTTDTGYAYEQVPSFRGRFRYAM